MSAIRSKGTYPELAVRRLLHRLGYRFRVHASDLPGKPDLVFSGRRKAVFVHGCFWHQHPDVACLDARRPQSNMEYWLPKLENNCRRDQENQRRLQQLGWALLVLWECEIRDVASLKPKLVKFLGPPRQLKSF